MENKANAAFRSVNRGMTMKMKITTSLQSVTDISDKKDYITKREQIKENRSNNLKREEVIKQFLFTFYVAII